MPVDSTPNRIPARPQANWIDVVLWLLCWPWALMRLIGRRLGWTSLIANAAGFFAAAVVISIAVALTQPGSPAGDEPMVSRLERTLGPDLQHWLTANSAAGISASIDDVTCEELGNDEYKCGVSGALTGAEAGRGHMTVLVTVENDQYTWNLTEGWTAD